MCDMIMSEKHHLHNIDNHNMDDLRKKKLLTTDKDG